MESSKFSPTEKLRVWKARTGAFVTQAQLHIWHRVKNPEKFPTPLCPMPKCTGAYDGVNHFTSSCKQFHDFYIHRHNQAAGLIIKQLRAKYGESNVTDGSSEAVPLELLPKPPHKYTTTITTTVNKEIKKGKVEYTTSSTTTVRKPAKKKHKERTKTTTQTLEALDQIETITTSTYKKTSKSHQPKPDAVITIRNKEGQVTGVKIFELKHANEKAMKEAEGRAQEQWVDTRKAIIEHTRLPQNKVEICTLVVTNLGYLQEDVTNRLRNLGLNPEEARKTARDLHNNAITLFNELATMRQRILSDSNRG